MRGKATFQFVPYLFPLWNMPPIGQRNDIHPRVEDTTQDYPRDSSWGN